MKDIAIVFDAILKCLTHDQVRTLAYQREVCERAYRHYSIKRQLEEKTNLSELIKEYIRDLPTHDKEIIREIMRQILI